MSFTTQGINAISQAFSTPNIVIRDAGFKDLCGDSKQQTLKYDRSSRDKIKVICDGNTSCAIDANTYLTTTSGCVRSLYVRYTCGNNKIKNGLTLPGGAIVNISCEKFQNISSPNLFSKYDSAPMVGTYIGTDGRMIN